MSDNDGTNTENLAEQLAQANERIAQMSEELSGLAIEQKLTHKLAGAGAIDLEAALLLARARIEGRTEADIDECVTRLRKEKAYLFGGSNPIVMPRKTASAKDRVTRNQRCSNRPPNERPGPAAAWTFSGI